MKSYAIIEDEEGQKRVISSNWLSKNAQKMKWPPYEEIDRIRKAVLGHERPERDWKEYNIRFIKDKDDYINAVDDIKANLDEDTSDPDKRKKSRSSRKRKIIGDAELFGKNKPKKTTNNDWVNTTENSDEDELSDDEHMTSQESQEDSSSIKTSKEADKNDEVENSRIIEQSFDTNSKNMDPESINHTDDNTVSSAPSSPTAQLTVNDKLDVIYETLKRVSQNVSVISQRLTLMETRMGKLENGNINGGGGEKQLAILSEMAKYFPIDSEDKLAIIEEKLGNNSFVMNVVTYQSQRRRILQVIMHHLYILICTWKTICNLDAEFNALNQASAKFMKSKGGSNAHDLVYNILSSVIIDEVAKSFSFFGQKKKKRFADLKLNTAVFLAVKAAFGNTTEEAIKISIKMWLDAATTRFNRCQQAAGRKKQCFVLPVLQED